MKRPDSFVGKFLLFIDNSISENLHLFLKKRNYSIDGIFLLIYTGLQFLLISLIYLLADYVNLIVSFFIIVFLFFISLERIILNFKTRIMENEKNNLTQFFHELKNENEKLRDDKESLTKMIQRLISEKRR